MNKDFTIKLKVPKYLPIEFFAELVEAKIRMISRRSGAVEGDVIYRILDVESSDDAVVTAWSTCAPGPFLFVQALEGNVHPSVKRVII